MKAITREQYGSPDLLQLKDINKPVAGDQELLVRVHAATVNRTDCAILRAQPPVMRLVTGLLKPRIPVTGTDFAGTVDAVGAAVTGFKAGDKVFGFDDNGLASHAEYLVISEKKAVMTMPENCSFEAAAASMEGAHYAFNFINKISLDNSHRVLINGASGAIGSAALQLAKYFGATVTAVCNSKNMERIRSLGADRVIDYEKEDFTADHEQYHFVFDTVGKSSFGRCKKLLLPGGVYMSSELGWMAQNLFYALFTPIFGGKKVIFPVPVNIRASLEFIRSRIEEGRFKALIDRSYLLEEAATAFRYVETGQKTGNVILQIAHPE
ncbi:MAG: NAD(P)-dependent alcohol dehydrogenase [Bacteroidetes bacterium]|nr:MAG: NAD(P)-dependent alcohol dehydrogenase [Bacteroidota bacterium]